MSAFTLIEAGSIITIESIEITSPLISSLTVSGAGGIAILIVAILGLLIMHSYGHIQIPSLSKVVEFSV